MAKTYVALHDRVNRRGQVVELCRCKLCVPPPNPDPRPPAWRYQVTIRVFGQRGFGVQDFVEELRDVRQIIDDYLVEASNQSSGILYSVTPRGGGALQWKHIGKGWKTLARAALPGLLNPLR